MAARFVTVDRDTPMLLPPSLQDWVPEDHLVHFIIDAVEPLDLRHARVNERGSGSEQYPPATMLALLVYSYATGTFASRRIEQSTFDNVAVRYLCADTHPDHDTICEFRRQNRALLADAFAQILELAARCQQFRVGDVTVASDGTKFLANASRHSAVGYERAGVQLEARPDPAPPTDDAPCPQRLAHRTATQSGRARYKQRQQTVEPAFGVVKACIGFRRFLLRGLAKVSLEWSLICSAYNLKRLHILKTIITPA